METKTLENAIGKTICVFTKGNQNPPCPPNGYVGTLVSVNPKEIIIHGKFGYTQQDKHLEFEKDRCRITKILIEESQEIMYEP
jgi:hypothetical protein